MSNYVQMESAEGLFRVASSKSAQRLIVNATLAVAGCLPLLCIAVAATTLFYNSYLPDQVVKTPVYLQYGTGPNPFGTSSLAGLNLKTQQPYDITVSVTMPLSPANMDRGNFMVSLYLLDSPASATTDDSEPLGAPDPHSHFEGRNVLSTSRRPALLPYRDPLVSVASRVIFLVYHLLVPDSEVLTLDIPMMERVELASSQSGMPALAYVEVVAGQTLQTYDVSITLTAQLGGLRWMMHHYRLATFLAATLVFWVVEVLFMLAAWVTWIGRSGDGEARVPVDDAYIAAPKARAAVKQEVEAFSDVPVAFPSYDRQPPFMRESRDTGEPSQQITSESVPGSVEVDSEVDDEGRIEWREDSGIGTSYSEAGGGAGNVRRRSLNR